MVTLKIDVPELEGQLRELAAARQMKTEDYLVELLTSHLIAASLEPRLLPGVEERKAALRRLADRIPLNAPLLSDEAFSRENLYDERGL